MPCECCAMATPLLSFYNAWHADVRHDDIMKINDARLGSKFCLVYAFKLSGCGLTPVVVRDSTWATVYAFFSISVAVC